MTFLCWLSSQEQVLTAVEEFKKFACMVTTLFPEGDFDYEQHVNAVTYFVNYPGNGQSLFAKAIRTLLRGTNDNEPDLLRDSVADVIRTAGSSASLRPKLQVQKSRIDVDELHSRDGAIHSPILLNVAEELRHSGLPAAFQNASSLFKSTSCL